MLEAALVLIVISVLICAHFVQVCVRELREIRTLLRRRLPPAEGE
ncbi:MAG: hypothetical protein O7E54_00125 [Planctomycetota bacterium]|nr:hypothetical protein [Planctomycetota bacterium]